VVLWPIPEAADHAEDLRMIIPWQDPEPVECEFIVKGWRQRKRMQVVMMYRDGTLTNEELFS
jgi:hypothetical protein